MDIKCDQHFIFKFRWGNNSPFDQTESYCSVCQHDNISSDLKEVKDSLDKIFSFTNGMSVPVGLRSVLYDTFRGAICQSTPPIIFEKCGKCILGCQSCVDTWYCWADGQTRTCPRCQSEREYVETKGVPILKDGPGNPDDLVDYMDEWKRSKTQLIYCL